MLRKFVRSILIEKNFKDFETDKGEWFDVPEEEIAIHRPEHDVDDEVFDLIDLAYKPVGGHVKLPTADALPRKYTFFDTVDVDDDPEADAVIFGKHQDGNLKLGGMGHDGGKGKEAIKKRKNQLLKKPGTYVETSGAPAHLALKAGNPAITDEEKVRAILKKEIEWVGKHPNRDFGPNTDGWYYRKIGPAGKKYLKILIGNM
tara:strand:+ start:727 stop:1332 length:606 start_codon:yes stop_codon:yes gene_type:complete